VVARGGKAGRVDYCAQAPANLNDALQAVTYEYKSGGVRYGNPWGCTMYIVDLWVRAGESGKVRIGPWFDIPDEPSCELNLYGPARLY
jgi:hypothetical protein